MGRTLRRIFWPEKKGARFFKKESIFEEEKRRGEDISLKIPFEEGRGFLTFK